MQLLSLFCIGCFNENQDYWKYFSKSELIQVRV